MKERSPITFWLLLAATIAANAVAVAWAYTATLNRTEVLYYGLACGQMSVLCIWVTFQARSRYWWWLPPTSLIVLVGVISCGLYDSSVMRDPNPREMALATSGLLLAQCALLFAALWLLQQTSFGDTGFEPCPSERWRFSLKQVFIVMTALAIVLVTLRQSKLIREVPYPVLVWIVNNVLLAVAAVFIRRLPLHSIMRLAGIAGIAIILGMVIRLVSSGQTNGIPLNLIQAIVLFTWLEFGEVFPESAGASCDNSERSSTPQE